MKNWSQSEPLKFHLRELLGDLTEFVHLLNGEPSKYEEDDNDNASVQILFGHLYHHLNSAWNSRDIASLEDPYLTSDSGFLNLARFPDDLTVWNSAPDRAEDL